MNKRMKSETWKSVFLVTSFWLLIATPMLTIIADIVPARIPVWGHDRPGPKPDYAKIPIARFPSVFEKYVVSTMPFRSHLLSVFLHVMEYRLGASLRLLFKGDGMRFFARDPVMRFMGQNTFSDEGWMRIRALLLGRYLWLRSKGIPYLFVFAPDGPVYYADDLPDWVKARKGLTRREEFHKVFSNVEFPVLDPKDWNPIEAGKYGFYNKLYDVQHWNGYAQLKLTLELEKWIRATVPGIVSHPLKEILSIVEKVKSYPPYGEEMVPMLQLSGKERFKKDQPIPRLSAFEHVENSQQAKGSFLFIHDSYGTTALEPVEGVGFVHPLAFLFRKQISLHYNGKGKEKFIRHEFLDSFLESSNPDAVIELRCEGMMRPANFPDDPFFQILGEQALGTFIIGFSSSEWVNSVERANVPVSIDNERVALLPGKNPPRIDLKPITRGADDRSIIAARIVSPEKSFFRVLIDHPEGAKKKYLNYPLHAGENLIYVPLFTRAGNPMHISLWLKKTSGAYEFLPLPEAEVPRKNDPGPCLEGENE